MSTTYQWVADPTHSEVGFRVKHLVISIVSGYFRSYRASVETTSLDDFEDAKVSFEADVATLWTGVEDRDNHLRSADFFDVEKYPTLKFVSKSFKKKEDKRKQFVLTGDLTIKDVTQEVTLDVEYGGRMKDLYGGTKAGFELTGSINRKQFGLVWDLVTEAGGIVVGHEIKIQIHFQLLQVQA